MLKAWMGIAALLLTSAAGCAVEPNEEEPTGESQDHLLAGRRLSQAEVARAIRTAGFPESVVGKMVCTAKYESSFYERASNHNRNGSNDYGLFQINSIHFGRNGCPSSASGLYDAAANAKCAYQVYKAQGINAWYGYKKHKSECDRTAAPAGSADPIQSDDPVTTTTTTTDPDTTPATPTTPTTPDTSSDDTAGGCYSATLEDMMDSGACVESKYDNAWMQCNSGGWYRGVSGNNGPFGPCTSLHPLQ